MALKPQVAWAQLALAPPRPGAARYLAVWLPAFPVERLGHDPDAPVILVTLRQGALRAVAVSPGAQSAGVASGMAVADARAACPEVRVEPWDASGEASDRAALVRALGALCDRVRAEPEDVVLMDISPVTTLYGGEAAVVDRVRARLDTFGHRCRVAVTDHPRAAWALARWLGQDAIVPAGEAAGVLAPLPVEALGPSPALAEAWRALGVRTLADLTRLDPASIAGRHGAEGIGLHRAARGLAGPPWAALPPPAPPDPVQVGLEAAADSVEAVMAALEPGLEALRCALRSRGRRVAAVRLRLELERGDAVEVSLRPARPTRDPVLLASLLRERLAVTRLSAPVVGLWLHPLDEVVDEGLQPGLYDRREAGAAWDALVSRLRDTLGDTRVLRPVPVDAWLPEEAWIGVPAGDALPEPLPVVADDPVEAQEGAAWRAALPRPLSLRPVPLPVEVQLRAGRPVAVRDAASRWSPIRRVRGPEVQEDGWWRPCGGVSRDAWIARTDHGDVWLWCERGAWRLAGWF